MQFLTQAFAIVIAPGGSAIYHILTLFALEAAFAIALGHWRRMGSESGAVRFAIAAGLSGAGRALLFLLGTLGVGGLFAAPAILPPLDRAISLAMTVLVAWSLVFRKGSRLGDAAMGAALLGVFVAYLALGIQWYALGASGAPYNPYDTFWEIAKLAVSMVGLIGLLIARPTDWGLALGLFGLLIGGVGFHLLDPVPTDSYPAAERIAELAALPLFAVIVYRQALGSIVRSDRGESQTRPYSPSDTSRPAAPETTASAPAKISLTPQAAAALALMGAPGDGPDVVAKITRAIGRTLLADVTLLFTPPEPNSTITCVGAYDLIREITLAGFTVPVSRVNAVVSAINRGRPARLRLSTHQAQLTSIARGLGLTSIGEAVMTPLRTADRNFGGIMVFSAFGQKEWTNDDHALLASLAEPVVAILLANESIHQFRSGAQRQLGEAARKAEEEQTEIRTLREKADQLAKELEEAREEARRNRDHADGLTTLIQANAAEGEARADQSAEIAALQTSYRRALEELAALNTQLADAQTETEKLRAALEEVERPLAAPVEDETRLAGIELPPAEQELTALTRQLADAQTEIMLLRSQLAKGTAVSTGEYTPDAGEEVAALSEELAGAEKELDTLRAKLRDTETELERLRPRARTADAETEELQAQLRHAEAQIEQLQIEVEAAHNVAAKSRATPGEQTQMAALVSLSQELRQPMSSIVGYADLLLGESVGILGALQRTFLERIRASTKRMQDILDDLIRLTAIDTGMLTLVHQKIEMAEVIEDAFTNLGIRFREKGISLRMDIADDLPTVEADRDAVYQIVSRMLANACAASAPNSEVVLTAQKQNGDLLLSVRDTGGGISSEDQPRVFAPVLRADRPLIQGLGDTGAGLSVAKALTEAQGGRMWVESEQGVGSTFSVLLPTNGHK